MDDSNFLKQAEVHDQIENELSSAFGSYGAVSFGQLEEVGKAQQFYDDVRALTTIASILLNNISYRFSPDANNGENVALIKQLVGDYTQRLDALTAEVQTDEQKSISEKTKGFIEKMSGFFRKEEKEQNFKTEDGTKFYASDFLYVPDKSKPSTWKLRIAEGKSGNVTIAQLGRAAAAFSSGGFRGNKVQLPGGESGRIKAKLRSKYRALGAKEDEIPESIRKEEADTFTLLKQEDGSYRWFAVHTNNFQDRDEDILSKDAHLLFVKALDEGLADYPELWHWHIPGTAWGKADMLAFDEDTGMMLSSGVVYKGHEAEAEALLDAPFAVGVSHGMPRTSVRRDPGDPRIITEYVTKEISDLPLVNAANRLTHFVIHKEEVMPIPTAKKDYLKSVGVPDEVISDLEATMKKSADEANKEGIVSKEVEGEPVVPAQTEDATPVVGETTEVKETDSTTSSAVSDEKTVTKEEIASAVAESVTAIFEKFTATVSELQAKVESLSEEVKSVKEANGAEAAVTKEQLELTPTSSLAAMISRNIMASTSIDTLIRKNSALTKEAPVETESDKDEATIIAGNPMLNSVISKIIGSDKSMPTQ